MSFTAVALFIQVVFGVIIGLYFWNLLKKQRSQKVSINKESRKELDQLRRLRSISLSEPLSEKVRPSSFDEVIGQEDGIRALRAALCGPHPQHVIIYGPPGIGKTAAARLVLEEAKLNKESPFAEDATFVELDGTTARFDERGIADPLIGSVHDPIYQGAGPMGQAGIPQPKQGAVTKAHGGMLFIDEIGELHSIQLNKLLKVLEDRKVFLESTYYSEENQQIPRHIHDIFQQGLPADFRLVGATTRTPEEIPPAIRSRCLEIFFRSLQPDEMKIIAAKAAEKMKMTLKDDAAELLSRYAHSGREAVNTIQIAAGLASGENRNTIELPDIEWVVHSSRLSPRPERNIHEESAVGRVNGLAVYGPGLGMLLDVEATARKAEGHGEVTVTGIAEEENSGNQIRSIRRKSQAKSSVENVMTVLRSLHIPVHEYDVHVNFPGGVPVDGPSAGVTMAVAIYSAVKGLKVDHTVAMSGELGIRGTVKPVGGIVPKVEAAAKAGAKKVFIPADNDQQVLHKFEGVDVIPVHSLKQVLKECIEHTPQTENEEEHHMIPAASNSFSPAGI